MKDYFEDIIKFLTNRVFLFFIIVIGLFGFLLYALYDMQIIKNDYYEAKVNRNTERVISVKAPRGEIYDRLGRPLAQNRPIFVISINRSMFDNLGNPLIVSDSPAETIADPKDNINNLNDVLFHLIKVLEKNDEQYIDDFPISKTVPYAFLFDDNAKKEESFIKRLGIDYAEIKTAPEFMQALEKNFGIPEEWTQLEKRNILSIRSALYEYKTIQYKPVVLAKDVGRKTITVIEEEPFKFHGVSIETDFIREYPGGKYFSHVLGYLGGIDEKTFKDYTARGYTYEMDDQVGFAGLEYSQELDLKGTNGERIVEVNRFNKKVKTISEVPSIQGDSLFLTLDIDLQKKVFEILESQLEDILMTRMLGNVEKEPRVTEHDVLTSLVKNNRLSINEIFSSTENSNMQIAKNFILTQNPDIDIYTKEGTKEAQSILHDGVENSSISLRVTLLMLCEQGVVTDTDNYFEKVKTGSISILDALVLKIKAKELTPHIVGLEPFSASVVLIDVRTGAVLLVVNYPTYDNNELMKDFNSYWPKLESDLITTPLYNRAFSELRAPGSTFKMISAIAALESEVITVDTTILDETVYKDAGEPFASCWSGVSHGHVNVVDALECSCNYFFFRVSNLLGDPSKRNSLKGIKVLNKYMIAFGLNDRSGVEIGEGKLPGAKDYSISSPALKRERALFFNKASVERDLVWVDGNTRDTSIGQYQNAYSTAVMAKYGATIASKGKRYKSHLIDKIQDFNENSITKVEPVLEKEIVLKDSTWDAIFEGMHRVIYGERGTARNYFAGFPIEIAGKTGTAEEVKDIKNAHTTFIAFAPFDNPEIAIYTIVPFGDTKASSAASTQISRSVLEEYFGLNSEIEYKQSFNSLSK